MKMITRTFRTFTINAEGYQMQGEQRIQVPVAPIQVCAKSMDLPTAMQLLIDRDSNLAYLITSIYSETKTIGMTEEKFLEHGVVIKNKEDAE